MKHVRTEEIEFADYIAKLYIEDDKPINAIIQVMPSSYIYELKDVKRLSDNDEHFIQNFVKEGKYFKAISKLWDGKRILTLHEILSLNEVAQTIYRKTDKEILKKGLYLVLNPIPRSESEAKKYVVEFMEKLEMIEYYAMSSSRRRTMIKVLFSHVTFWLIANLWVLFAPLPSWTVIFMFCLWFSTAFYILTKYRGVVI